MARVSSIQSRIALAEQRDEVIAREIGTEEDAQEHPVAGLLALGRLEQSGPQFVPTLVSVVLFSLALAPMLRKRPGR